MAELKDYIKKEDLDKLVYAPTIVTKTFGPLVGTKRIRVEQASTVIEGFYLTVERKEDFYTVYNEGTYVCIVAR